MDSFKEMKFMKKFCLIPLFLASTLLATPLQACTINLYYTGNFFAEMLDKNPGGWVFKRNYDDFCQKLQQANATLRLDGHATVLTGRSIASVVVSVQDKKLPIRTGEYSQSTTNSSSNAGMDVAIDLLWESTNTAIDGLDIDRAIASLNNARSQIRLAHSTPRK